MSYNDFGQRNKSEQEIKLLDKFDTEEVSKSGHNLFKRRRLFDKGSKFGSAYVDSKVFDARFLKDKIVHIINKDASVTIRYKWLACINPSKWHVLIPETLLVADTDVHHTNSEAWAFFKVQVRGAGAGQEVEAFMGGLK